MPTNLVSGVNTMNCDAITKSAASQEAPEARALRFQVTNVSLAQNGQGTVRGLSLATLAAALAACGGGGSGGPAAPPPPPPPPPPNNAPTGTDATATAVEDGDPATGSAVGSDEDGDSLTYKVTSDPSLGTLALADDGSWTYTITDSPAIQELGVGDTLTDTATIEISDGEAAATATVTITIEGANDDPTAEDGMGMVTAGTDMAAMGNVNAADVDSGDTHTFAVTTEATHGTLTVDAMGAWTYELDHGNEAVRKLGHGEMMEDTGTITVTDSSGGTAEVTVAISITGIVEAPDVSAMSADVDENDMSGPNLLTVSSPDTGVTFSVDNDKFEIDTVGATSVLKLKDGMYLDHEGTGGMVTLMITASDGTTTSAATEVAINVGDVNEAPTAEDGTGSVQAGGETAAMASGNVMAMDVDDGDTHTFAVTTHAEYGTLAVDDMGAWTYTLAEDNDMVRGLDAGAMLMDEAMITVTDADGLTATSMVTITIDGFNDAPTITVVDSETPDGMPARSSIPENQAGVPVGEIMVSDPDAADAMLGEGDISLSGEHAMYFEVKTDDEGGIWLKLKDDMSLNFEKMPSVTVTVTVTDNGMATAMDTVTVTVGNVNEAPSIEVDDAMIAENMTGTVGIVTIFDNEEERDITLDVEDIRVVGRDDFEVVEPTAGEYELRLTKALDFEMDTMRVEGDDSMGYVEVVLQITDSGLNGSDPITTTETIKVMVTNIDEEPTITVMDGMTPDGMMAVSSIYENSNADGDVPVGEIMASDPEDGVYGAERILWTGEHADRFDVKPDDEGGLWLVLKEGAMADFEGDMGSIDITLVVEDSAMQSVSQDFSLTLMDVPERPTGHDDMVMKLVDHDSNADTPAQAQKLEMYEPATAGEMFSVTLDITNAFEDQDGDTLFTYSIMVTNSDGEVVEWLDIGTPVRDDDSVVVTISGNVLAGELGAHEVMLYAEDQDGMKGMVSFNLIVDDGNDAITDITLTNPDGTENIYFDVTVDENDESGRVLGYLTSVDLDDPRHPHGAHKNPTEEGAMKWSVTNPNFEIVEMNGMLALKLKGGMSLDYEAPPTSVVIEVTDGDGTKYSQSLALQINNKNDAPTVKTQPGNWWVTVDEDLDADDVAAGQWLTFHIEGADDPTPLFEDKDAGEELTYELSGPGAAFLQINDMGVIQNKAGMIADRGVYDVTVTAKDGDGVQTDPVTFKLAVVLSDENDEDKATPEIENANGMDFREGSDEGEVVARFTVENPDLDMKGVHPWGAMTVKLTAAHNTSGDSDMPLDLDYFKAEMESHAGGSEVWVVKVTEAGAKALNHEAFDDVRLTVKVWDNIGTGNSEASPDDERTINFDVTDRDEPIMYMPAAGDHSTSGLTGTGGMLSFTTMQQTDPNSDTVTLYLNLSKLFEDEDTDDDDDEMEFFISANSTPWLTIKQHPMEWRDIEDANEDDEDPTNDVIWGGTDQTSLAGPDARDIVAIIEIDRDGMMGANPAQGEIGQDDDGSFTISVTGQDSADRATATVMVKITDQNLPAAPGGVTISNTKPAQGNMLTMRFEESKDPDFTGPKAGTPIAELYLWKTDNDAEDGGETTKSVSINNPMPYVLTDAEEGMHIGATVVYFELFNGNIEISAEQDATHTAAVVNRNDDPELTLAAMGTDGNELVFTVTVTDADGIPDDGKVYKWEYSANGVSGWKGFADDNTSTPMKTTIPADVVGNYVRLVVTFTDEGGKKESVEAQTSFKVGALVPPPPPQTLNVTIERGEVDVNGLTYVKAGGQLKLNGITPGARIEWLLDGKNVIGNKETLDITQAYAGEMITVKVTGMKDGNVTYITPVTGWTVAGVTGDTGNSDPSKAMDMIVPVGAAKAEGMLFDEMVMIDFSTLFDDVEGGLTYNITEGPAAFASDALGDEIHVNQYMDENTLQGEGDQLLLVDESDSKNVKFYYYSTKGMTHDGNPGDGEGNIVAVTVTATDTDGAMAEAMAGIRIDVPATGVVGRVSDAQPFHLQVDVEEDAMSTDDQKAGMVNINILDENDSSHDYGSYDWANAVVSDGRFEVVAVEGDKSAATFSLKKGATLDNVHEEMTIPVTVKVKPLGAITDEVTITVNVIMLNTDGSRPPGSGQNANPENTVPGLKDNEADDENDSTDDEGSGTDDDDEDGGMAAMMSTMVDDGLF